MSCTEGLEEATVWQLGLEVAGARRDQVSLRGRADLPASAVRAQGLEVVRDDQPLYHANILGWSAESKEAQRQKALELAAASRLVLYPEPTQTNA